jgi:hypothetical protein
MLAIENMNVAPVLPAKAQKKKTIKKVAKVAVHNRFEAKVEAPEF